MKNLIFLLTMLFFVGCSQDNLEKEGDVVSDLDNPADVIINEPHNLSYSITNLRYYIDSDIVPNHLTFSGSKDELYFSTTPALPPGLSIDPENGTIMGHPTVLMTPHFFTVRVENAFGSATITLSIEVVIPPPKNLNYTDLVEVTLFNNIELDSAKSPTVEGVVSSFSISPALPQGLSFNTASGTITGRPTQLRERTLYTVRANNSTGFDQYTFFLRVIDIPPENLVYNIAEATYMVNQEIQVNTPFYTGGVPTLFISTPINLPTGLSLNALTGVISGKPLSEVASFQTFTITAINTGGESSTTIKIKVEDIPPATPVYQVPSINYTKDVAIQPNLLLCAGSLFSFSTCPDGKPTSVQIQPSLPQGLSYNSYTGAITGTPTELSPLSEYTIISSNTGGTKLGSLFLGVVDKKPDNLRTRYVDYVIRKDEPFSTITPYNDGGPVVSYELLTPNLPTGLSFDEETGIISGTPTTENQTPVSITVRGTNSGGSATFTITIKVMPVPFYAFEHRLISKNLENGHINYSFEIKNISREYDDLSGVRLPSPIDINSVAEDSNFVKNLNPTISTCFLLDNDNNYFNYEDTCVLSFSYPALLDYSDDIWLEIKAAEVHSVIFNLKDFVDITPTDLVLTSDRGTIVKGIKNNQSLGVHMNMTAYYNITDPAMVSNITNLTGQYFVRTESVSSLQLNLVNDGDDVLLVNDDPDDDGVKGISFFNNLDFTNHFNLSGDLLGYSPNCAIQIPYRELTDCEIGNFSITSYNINESGDFKVNISLAEGLPSEVGESNPIDIHVYQINRIINSDMIPKNLVLYNNRVYFEGLMDSVSTNSRKLLSYSPFTSQVRQVSNLRTSDDRAYPFSEMDGLLFFKGADLSNASKFLVYDEQFDKISQLNNLLIPANNFNDTPTFKYKNRVYFKAKLSESGIEKEDWFYYEKSTNQVVRPFQKLYNNSNVNNGMIDPRGFVSYNNKLFFYSHVYNVNGQNGYKLQSIDDVAMEQRLVSNINTLSNNLSDYLVNGVVYDNKIFYLTRTPSEPIESSLIYYDEISNVNGEFVSVFKSSGYGEGSILGVAFGKLFFTLPMDDGYEVFYYDGASRNINKVYTTNNSLIYNVERFSNLENKQIVYFVERDAEGYYHLFSINQNMAELSIKQIVNGENMYINQTTSMFNYNNTLFFSCDMQLQSLCTFNDETNVLSKIADGLNFKIEPHPMGDKKGVLLFNNRVYFSNDDTATGEKPGVYELCLKGPSGCLDNLD